MDAAKYRENAYKMFDASPTTEISLIRKKYKQLAKKMHPDHGGSEMIFRLLQESYCFILKERKSQQEDKNHCDLKSTYEQEKEGFAPNTSVSTDDPAQMRVVFNQVFEKNKMQTPMDDGYGEMMASSTSEREELKIKRKMKKFSLTQFNKSFDKQRPVTTKHIVARGDPAPVMLSKHLEYTELGQGRLSDFSGNNDDKRCLHFMDYKKAYSTNKLVDRTIVQTPKNETIQELEHKRENISMVPTTEQQERYAREEAKRTQYETKRVNTLKTQDDQISTQFNRVSQIMSKYKNNLH